MKKQLFQSKLIVKKSKMHGYGVFAGKTFQKGELIEECYMVVSNGGDKKLQDYYFDAKGKSALFTGFGSIYNHSDDPNADYFLRIKQRYASIKAIKKIPKGSEIFVSYGEEWFKSRNLKPKDPDNLKKSAKKPQKK